MAENAVLSREQLETLSKVISDALLELNVQRRRAVERSGPTSGDSLDLGRSIEALQAQAQLIGSLVPPAESALVVRPPEKPTGASWPSGQAPQPPTVQMQQWYIRYYFQVYGYDQQFLDIFVALPGEPSEEQASRIVEKALRLMDLEALDHGQSEQSQFSPLLRDGRSESWDYEVGVQEPVIPVPPGKALLRKYRLRNYQEEYPHLSKVVEKIVDRSELL